MKRTWAQANAQEYGQLGIIESLKLRNFMCHENLSFDFDPHMNFIIGRNGSGKSAVLTGIILALGGKSSATGRYCNIKGFVKTGKNTASVSVTLKNCGPEAYKPDIYGTKITIERQFSLDGSNCYKLKSESGKIISSSKEELTNILNVMDIQVENPVTVLVQDTSKNFLVSKTSKGDKLFKLFYEGTGLSKVYDDYNRALQQSQDAKSELKIKKAVLNDMEKDMKSTKALLERSTKIRDLEKELFWAIVKDFENKRDEAVADLENSQKTVSELTQKLNRSEEEITVFSQNTALALSEKKISQDKMVNLRKEMQEKSAEKAALNTGILEIAGTLKRHKRELERIEGLMSGLEEQMNQTKMQNQQDLDEEKCIHEQVMKNLQNEIDEICASAEKADEEKNTLQNKMEEQKRKIDTCSAEMQELTNEKIRIEKEKQQIMNSLKNRLYVFGMETEAVLKDINAAVAAGMFKKAPVGPLGQFIDVKKPEWTFAIQECLKLPLLKSFLCDNSEDGDQLSKIFSKHYDRHMPSIIISKFLTKVYDVSTHKCICSYPTVLDMLKISLPFVANCLIDQRGIENILLVKDPVEARNLVLHNPPKNCSFVYASNGDQFCHSPVRKYSCRNKNRLCILKSFQEDDIKKKEEEIKKVDNSISEKRKCREFLLQELYSMEKAIESYNARIRNFNLQDYQLRMQLKNVESSYVESKDISNLQTDWEAQEVTKNFHLKELAACEIIFSEKTQQLNDLMQNLSHLRETLQRESDNFGELSKKVEEYQSLKEKSDSLSKKIKSQLAKVNQECKEKERKVADDNSTLELAIQRAQQTCDRIDTEKSADSLRRILSDMRNQLPKQKQVDRESLAAEYVEKHNNFNKATKELQRQEKINERLLSMISERFKEFQKICKNTSVALTCTFTTLLKENNFIGYPHVDFEMKTLEIRAKPENSRPEKCKFGTKPKLTQLSGGERSYVTIAFLLALWDRIRSPFRILDEYDVFMDSNNRHRSIHLLINTAKSNKKIQYIFLSPLELPHIEDSDHVKVHKMSDPRS